MGKVVAHTPGPWRTGTLSAAQWVFFSNQLVADCAFMDDKAANCANARLIATAPDLLHALKALVEATSDVSLALHDRDRRNAAIARQEFAEHLARAAIAKATEGA